MLFSGGILSSLDVLFQKSIRYNHHKNNYERSLLEGIIPTSLKLNERPALETVADNVLFDTEKKLVKLLLEESKKVIGKIEIDINNEVKLCRFHKSINT